MAIHHDKKAYGKLSSLTEEFSEDKILNMVKNLEEKNMTEYEKMINGELYCTADKELGEMFKKATELYRAFNLAEDAETRYKIACELLGSHGKNFCFVPPIHFDYGINTHIGEKVYANYNLTVLDCAPVKIGTQVFIGPNVTLATAVHPFLACDRNFRVNSEGALYDYEYAKPITIEDNVWIASSVTICGGVTIGHDSVIGAGSVVTHDIPSGVLAAGVPCKVIRKLTREDKMKMPNE